MASVSKASDGVIRIGRKGRKKFAIGEEGEPFEVDIVEAWYKWIAIDDSFRPEEEDENGDRRIPRERMPEYHNAAIAFVQTLSGGKAVGDGENPISRGEALEFINRIYEEHEALADFFQPKSRRKQESQDSSETETRFSEAAP